MNGEDDSWHSVTPRMLWVWASQGELVGVVILVVWIVSALIFCH